MAAAVSPALPGLLIESEPGDGNDGFRSSPLGAVAKKSPPRPSVDANKVLSAARAGNVEFLREWVEQGGDLQQKLDSSFVSWTPLQLSCAEGDAIAVSALLDAGADPNFNEGHDGYGALHIAARYGHSHLVAILVKYGASGNLVDRLGHTPLHYAATSDSVNAARAIMEAGVDLDAQNRDKHTALELAVVQNSAEVAKAIREKRAETWARTDSKVSNWLQSVGLAQYTDLLLSQGWDDIDFIADAGFSEGDLDTLGVHKAGHRRKFLSRYRVNEFASPREDFAKGDESDDGESDSDEDSSDEDSDEDSDESDSDSD